MEYKITGFNPIVGVISILYADGISVNLDLPVTNNAYPDNATLNEIIINAYPNHYAQRLAELKTINFDHITEKIQTLDVAVMETNNQSQPEQPAETPEVIAEKEAIFKEAVREVVREVLAESA